MVPQRPLTPVPGAVAAGIDLHVDLTTATGAYNPNGDGLLRDYCAEMAKCQESDTIPHVTSHSTHLLYKDAAGLWPRLGERHVS